MERTRLIASLFQSTPPVSGRRCTATAALAAVDAVSIHAPRFREAMARSARNHGPRRGFNPRPPFPGGDEVILIDREPVAKFQSTPPVSGRRCFLPAFERTLKLVSIHAPRFREAMVRCLVCAPGNRQFQSTPPVSGRRWVSARPCRTHQRCFNPRPPFPGGDGAGLCRVSAERQVSIHAPRFREAMVHQALRRTYPLNVSIHAPRFREAMNLIASVLCV